MERNRKNIILLTVAFILIAVIGATFAYFTAQMGEGAEVDVSATTESTDSLMFENTGNISISANQTNFNNTSGSLKGNASAKATLKPNSATGSVKKTYNVFLVIENNTFDYTLGGNKPELLLKLTDPNDEEYAMLVDDLTHYDNVKDRDTGTFSGYDITDKQNIVYKMVENYEIEATDNETVTQEWKVEVVFINYEGNQNANTNKNFIGSIYITTEENLELTEIRKVNLETSSTSITATVQPDAGTAEIDKYYFAIEEVKEPIAMAKTNIVKLSNVKLDGFVEETSPSHVFSEGITEGHSYKVSSYTVDKKGFMSNIYETVVKATSDTVPSIASVIATLGTDNIEVSVTASNASKYYYRLNNEDWIDGEASPSHTFSSLKSNTNYRITVKVESEAGQTNTYVIEKVTTLAPTLSDYIMANAPKDELIQHTEGVGASDDNYRFTGGDYKVATGKKTEYETIYDIIPIKVDKDGSTHRNNYIWVDSNRHFYLAYQEETTSKALGTLLSQAIENGYIEKDEIHNYVCFGSSESICPKDNLYRIIGVYGTESNRQVKLVKAGDASKEQLGQDGSFGIAYVHDVTYIGDSDFKKDAYYWNKEGTSKQAAWADSSLNKTNLNTNFVNYLTSLENGKWIEKIADTSWQVGGMTVQNGHTLGAKTAYDNELGVSKNPVEEQSKIGLMYVSDYYYAALQKYWSLMGYDGAYEDVSIEENTDYRGAIWDNWLWDGDSEWLITPRTNYATGGAFYANHNGHVAINDVAASRHAIRPCFYLNSNVTYFTGDGSLNNPYRIN